MSASMGEPRAASPSSTRRCTLLDGTSHGEHLLELAADAPGLTLYAATFG
jgi:hypothetical protein